MKRTVRTALLSLVALVSPALLPAADEAPAPQAAPEAADGGIIGRRPLETAETAAAASPVSGGDALKMLGALAAVIGTLVGGVWFLRRMAPGVASGSDNRLIEVLSRSAVGPKQSLVLVRVGSRMVLIGVSPESMQKLVDFDSVENGKPAAFALPPAPAQERAREKPFGSMIRGMVSGFRAVPVGEFEAEEAVEFRVKREIDAIRRKLSAWEEEEKSAPAATSREGGRPRAGDGPA